MVTRMLLDTPKATTPRPAPSIASSSVVIAAEPPAPAPLRPWAILAGGLLLIFWAFFSTLDLFVEKWIGDPQYSHGFLVPFFSLYLLRGVWQSGKPWYSAPQPLFAAGAFLLAFGLRLIAGGLLFVQLDAVAMIVSLFALALAAGGTRMAKVAAPAILYLIFLVPLPYELERNVGGPLKIVATQSSTFLLQTLGYPAVAEGNLILIDEVRLGVIDACSGLKMLMTFAAFAIGAVLLLERTWFEKFIVVLGILPIAIITNVLRITGTGVVYTLTTNKETQNFSHDLFGWLMMPAGLGLLALQLWILSRLVVPPAPKEA